MIAGEIILVGKTMQIIVKKDTYRERDVETLYQDGWECVARVFRESSWYEIFEKYLR